MRNLLAGILMALGLLICGTSGLCTLWFLTISAIEAGSAGSLSQIGMALVMAAVVGGIPFAIGLFMYFLGKSANRAG